MKRQKTISKLWKRGFSLFLANALAFSALPVLSAPVLANVKSEPLLKAGSVGVSAQNVTKGEPFPAGTANSDNFRIPALVTTETGALVAAADARYDRISADGSSPDGGGLDTIASVSEDGGKTWFYSLPIYFPDSSQNAFTNATTIIDPALMMGPDNTIYCIADACPTGVTTMGGFRAPGCGTGFIEVNGEWRLALTTEYTTKARIRPDAEGADYEYYVGDFEDGYAPVLSMEDDSPSEYVIDEWYNLYSDAGNGTLTELTQTQVDSDTIIQQNVFYGDSALHVYETGYLFMVSSKDNGRTWENPTILNTQIKRSDDENDQALLVSPGKGITTNSGDIVLGCYNWKPGRESASMIYSTDNGASWRRTEDMETVSGTEIDTSSENEIVELKDGTLRMFFRHGGYQAAVGNLCYVDAKKQTDGSYQLGTPVQTDISIHRGCNLSALSYSREIDGKQVILVSAPSGVRANGQILTLLVNEDADQTLECIERFSVPGGQGGYGTFVYSCMSELQDGSIGLLWEPNHRAIRYNRFAVDETGVISEFPSEIPVELEKDGTYTQENYEGEGTVTIQPDASIASVSVTEGASLALYDHIGTATSTFSDAFSSTPNNSLSLSGAEFVFTKTNGDKWTIKNEAANVYLNNSGNKTAEFYESTASEMDIVPDEGTFRISNVPSGRDIIFYKKETNFNAYDSYDSTRADYAYGFTLFEKDASATDSPIPGYKQANEIVSGKSYLITYPDTSGKIAVLYAQTQDVTDTNRWYVKTKLLQPSALSSAKTITITGIGEGYTTAVIDGAVYDIHVSETHPAPAPGCSHAQTTLKNQKAAGCETMGYSGDKICNSCNAVIETGSILSAGHNWDKGQILTEVTEETDGLKQYTCQTDRTHKKTEIIYASAFSLFLDAYKKAFAQMEDLREYPGLYENEAAFEAACAKAHLVFWNKDASRSTMYRLKDELAKTAADLRIKPLSALQAELAKAIQTAKADIASIPNDIPASIRTAFENAYQKATAKMPDGLSEEEQSKYVYNVLKALNAAQYNLDKAKAAAIENALAQARKKLNDTLEQAKAAYANGASSYTQSSWSAFEAAYLAAANAPQDADAATLNGLSDALAKAQAALQAAPAAPKTDTVTYKNVQYKILNAAKKTAVAVKCTNKKATKITIPATVNIQGVNYKIVQIKANAFKNAQKMTSVIIGKNVTQIGTKAFYNCKKLSKVTFKGTGVKKIGASAFKKTSSKMTVKVPKALKKGKKRTEFLKKLVAGGMSKNLKL